MQTLPNYLYALFTDGERMTGKVYGKLFFDRNTARAAKVKAVSSTKIEGRVTISRVAVGHDWLTVR